MESNFKLLENLIRMLVIIAPLITFLKLMIISDVEKKIEPYYMKKIRAFYQELFLFMYLLLVLSSVNYMPNLYINSVSILWISIISYFLSFLILEHKVNNEINSNEWSLKKVINKCASKPKTFSLISICSIVLLFVIFNNMLIRAFIDGLGENYKNLSDVLYKYIELDTANYHTAILFSIVISSFYLFMYLTFRSNIKMNIQILVNSNSTDYYQIIMKNGYCYYNTSLISRNNEAYIIGVESCDMDVIIFTNEISRIEITKEKRCDD